MAVDSNWLHQVRMRNREQFGMAPSKSSLSGLGAGSAQDLAETLQRVRAARAAQGMSEQERGAAIRAQEALASDPRTAALLALPAIEIPQAAPIPKGVLIVGGIIAAGLLGLILVQAFGRRGA